jgi:ribosome-associated protein
MLEAIAVAPGVVVPAAALEMRVSRSSGPGGQNVNKVASKVELRLDVGLVVGLSGAARARQLAIAANRLDADGRIVVVSQRTRDQPRNIEDASDKIRQMVARALVAPKRRRATRPSTASRERRLSGKKHRAEQKAHRRRPGLD